MAIASEPTPPPTANAEPSGVDEGRDAAAPASAPPPSEAPESEEADSRAVSPSKVPPPSATLNQRAADASNAKQARIREAEEDRGLIAKAQQGDTAAFRQLVERHQRRAFAIALSLVRDENDARELVQDAFLRVYKGLPSFQGGSSFFTWLYRIITNLSIDLIRKPGRQLVEIDEERFDADEGPEAEFPLLSKVDGSDPVDVVRRQEIAGRLQAALDALPPYHRGVIVMREIEGLSYEEMATAMGVSKGTIMSRLFHARQKLQKALADCYEEQIGKVPTAGSTQDGEEA
ncbi:MAG: sigma-70 family RNA polymerase sigma factor [Labilithrix sp.]|nr:sigma-70 family RNA polymerase sigma factor [Labilithrix sp.]MCW5811990.1 sigma-70 family RNA polymerase sigma factor [Labilithrix sp.]